MINVQSISEIHSTLGFTEFDISTATKEKGRHQGQGCSSVV